MRSQESDPYLCVAGPRGFSFQCMLRMPRSCSVFAYFAGVGPFSFPTRSPSGVLLPFLGEGSPTNIDYRKTGILILTSLLEDLAYHWIGVMEAPKGDLILGLDLGASLCFKGAPPFWLALQGEKEERHYFWGVPIFKIYLNHCRVGLCYYLQQTIVEFPSCRCFCFFFSFMQGAFV